MTDYPYVLSNNRLDKFMSSIQAAGKPNKFTIEFLRTLGYTSTNDRGFIRLLKKLGFLTDEGTPTLYYDQLRDASTYKKTLANQIKELYSELFSINVKINSESDTTIKGAISRVTGGDEASVNRIFNTFKALCKLADFDHLETDMVIEKTPKKGTTENIVVHEKETVRKNFDISKPASEFHYNIQIHLPATTDISVYNAIFKSLRENLLI